MDIMQEIKSLMDEFLEEKYDFKEKVEDIKGDDLHILNSIIVRLVQAKYSVTPEDASRHGDHLFPIGNFLWDNNKFRSVIHSGALPTGLIERIEYDDRNYKNTKQNVDRLHTCKKIVEDLIDDENLHLGFLIEDILKKDKENS